MGFFDFLKQGLQKTRDSLGGALDNLFNGRATIDDDLFEEIEEALVSADMGFETSMDVIDTLRDAVAEEHIREPQKVRQRLVQILKEKLLASNLHAALCEEPDHPMVILVIGVNGVGKTTTIGKLAAYLKGRGKSVLLAAADTFRAAAIDQLEEWSHRADVDIVRREEGADPASVVFDGIHAAKARGTDVLICDTAGRLHNKKNLMQELEKIYRILSREYHEAHLETLLVLDATTGQNAIQQARAFNEVTDITGLVLTKLDGTAKGGVVFPLQLEVKVPVKFIGVGEQMQDLRPFDAAAFVDAIFS
ncbi:signal recognition particle-docking protein FtsY [uncultured Murdochiella sp.]|uniref:signal recognition particle-docking protein FtsY n=1 Tax=uncultured Murdochiella sp. TaxID=1586095 RepID=UPI002803892A|nr:signal recognition particle-docking protein FtsY [uncultured Murdochiella sp.]